MTFDRDIAERLEDIRQRYRRQLPLRQKLLLIRPTVSGDYFTNMSHEWAERVNEKAIAEGWDVVDLSGMAATRSNIENALSTIALERPNLVIHYDHGSEFTLYGHTPERSGMETIDDITPAIDERNIELTAGMFVSAMACFSASGLGPLAIFERTSGYLGYTSALIGSFRIPDRFGEAVNAPNFAILEGKSPEEAFEIGYQAWDRLYEEEADAAAARSGNGGGLLDLEFWDAGAALCNRDCFTLLRP
jgi:hypothetical protein